MLKEAGDIMNYLRIFPNFVSLKMLKKVKKKHNETHYVISRPYFLHREKVPDLSSKVNLLSFEWHHNISDLVFSGCDSSWKLLSLFLERNVIIKKIEDIKVIYARLRFVFLLESSRNAFEKSFPVSHLNENFSSMLWAIFWTFQATKAKRRKKDQKSVVTLMFYEH